MLMEGYLKSTVVAAFKPSNLAVIEKLKVAVEDYKKNPFSLDRRSKFNQVYGADVITIMRRYSNDYPEFLVNPFFAFYFADERRFNPNQIRLTGLRLKENDKGMIDTEALAKFIQVLLKVFDLEDAVFITPIRGVDMRGGQFWLSELVAVTRTKIINKDVLDFVKEQVHLMDERAKAKNERI